MRVGNAKHVKNVKQKNIRVGHAKDAKNQEYFYFEEDAVFTGIP
jgi:hypothetical protein